MAGIEERAYTIQAIEEDEINIVLSFLKRTFYIDEPLTEALMLCPDGISPEYDDYCSADIPEGLSFKAVDVDGNIIALTLSGTYKTNDEHYLNEAKAVAMAESCQNLKMKKLFYVLAERERLANLPEKYHNQELLEVKVAATDPLWRCMGIMNALVNETEMAAKRRGITLLRMNTSSAYSAKSAEKQGFTCISKILYSEILNDGEPLIVPKPPHLYDRVFVKELSGARDLESCIPACE